MSQSKAKATIPTGDTSEAVLGPILFELNEGERAMTKHNHDLGNFYINSGGAGGQVEQVLEDQVAVETPPKEDPIELGAEDNSTTVRTHAF